MKKIGRLLEGSVTGLCYQTDSLSGNVNNTGHFEYIVGESITFSIGGMPIGSCLAKEFITPLDFVQEAAGRLPMTTHYHVTNISRFLLTLGHITKEQSQLIESYASTLMFVLEPKDFEVHPSTIACMQALGKELISIEKTHNLVRRTHAKIKKETNVKIPLRDGRYLFADIYHPLKPGKYPVIMSMGVFGKSFVNGLTITEEDEVFFDKIEDKFYEEYGNCDTKRLLQAAFFKRMGPCFASATPIPNLSPENVSHKPSGPPPCLVPVSEVFEQPAAYDWVPHGYCVINIEEYGIGKNPGTFKQFGAQNAIDYCDAIEWAAEQEWSTGKIGLFGASYYAMTQYLAAQRKPKGLSAMIPIMGDYDSYRDYIYSGGGLFNRADNMDPCIPPQEFNFIKKAFEEPFWNEETYGSEGEYMSSCDISKIDLPIWPAVEPDATLHGRGSSEAYINCSSPNKKLLVLNGCGIHFWMYGHSYLQKYRDFFDHWLKGIENDIMKEPPVALQIRTGNGNYRWRYEQDWPVPQTKYVKLYLDASTKSLATTTPTVDASVTYDADVMRFEQLRTEGVTFISQPFEEEVELAGYIKTQLFVSSTTCDMELHIQVRVLDENDEEVIYPAITSMERSLPLAFGSLKVSHRALDPLRTRDDLPVYLHTKEAYCPLKPNEIVDCQVGSFPTTGCIRKGHKIRLDIDPVSIRFVCYEEGAYRKDSQNTIYTGPMQLSFLQIPVLPK